MNNKNNPKLKLNPDFKHRLSPIGDEADPRCVADTIIGMAERAKAVLVLLSGQFTDDVDKLNDQLIYQTIESVIREIEDINAVIRAYHEAHKAPIEGGAA